MFSRFSTARHLQRMVLYGGASRHLSTQEVPLEEVRDQNGKLYRLRRTNEKFESYFRHQKICPEEDMDHCFDTMRTDLPAAFRLNQARPAIAEQLKKILHSGNLRTSDESALLTPVSEDETIWRCNQSRWDLTIKPENQLIKQFLMQERLLGNLGRQELVSQVPVRLVQHYYRPHHLLMDQCASPGSKTRQMVEALHASTKDPIPSGFIIANEFNPVRVSRLATNLRMIASPCVVIVNHDGAAFPEIDLDKRSVRYNHITCDEPCSGDGTIRKNPTVWQNWSPGLGNSLHQLQYEIARRGLALLDVGGTFAYSTCSINPIENEAVVARLLEEANGNLDVEDCSERMRQLGINYLPGLTDWRVFDKRMEAEEGYTSLEQVPQNYRHNIKSEGMFPPRQSAHDQNLRRCLRFLPHLNNDGGFFVAILRKTGELSWSNEKPRHSAMLHKAMPAVEVNKKNVKSLWVSRKKFNFVEANSPLGEELKQDISALDADIALGGRVSNMYNMNEAEKNIGASTFRLTNDAVKAVLKENSSWKLNITAAGMSLFSRDKKRSNNLAGKKPSKDGTAFLLPLMGPERVVKVSTKDFLKLLEAENASVAIDDLSSMDVDKRPSVGWSKMVLESDPNMMALVFMGNQRVQSLMNEAEIVHWKQLLINQI